MKQIFDEVCLECSRNTTRSYSTSFSLGVRFLAKEFRDPIHAVYGFVRFADEIVDVLRISVGVPRLAGCSAKGVIANQWEFEQKGGISVGLFHLSGSRIESLSFSPDNSKRRPEVARPTIGGG